MKNKLPHRIHIKRYAKQVMMHPTAMRATLLFVCVLMAFFGIRYLTNGTLSYALVDLSQYANTATGIYFTEEGFSLILRMDLTQTVLAIPIAYAQLRVFLLVNAVLFILIAPLRVGVMEQYWAILQDKPMVITRVFHWYQDLKLFVKAVVVEFLLGGVVRLVAVVATLPSFYLIYRFYSTVTTMESVTPMDTALQFLSMLLSIVAALVAFWLHTFFLPVRYCLALHPEYSWSETFQRGFESVRGYRAEFFRFRLSYAVWFILSQLSYGVLDLYVMPYSSFGSMLFLQEVSKARNGDA